MPTDRTDTAPGPRSDASRVRRLPARAQYDAASVHAVLDAAFVRRARAHSMSVGIWTVNEPDDVTRLLAIGVRAFVTDDPERILAALGRPPPLSAR